MGRYIDAELALKLKDKDMNYVYDLYDLEDFLAGVPAANVVEVKHGEWKRVECGTICTQCRRVYDNDFEFSHEKVKQYFKYCPECGADMRERGNN